jgi:inactivated superfamily I helicase
MNFARALADIAEHGVTDNYERAALARDTIYMPSDLAARLLSRDAYRDHEPHFQERLVWDAMELGAARRSPAR